TQLFPHVQQQPARRGGELRRQGVVVHGCLLRHLLITFPGRQVCWIHFLMGPHRLRRPAPGHPDPPSSRPARAAPVAPDAARPPRARTPPARPGPPRPPPPSTPDPIARAAGLVGPASPGAGPAPPARPPRPRTPVQARSPGRVSTRPSRGTPPTRSST